VKADADVATTSNRLDPRDVGFIGRFELEGAVSVD
jgi:hypothetical protein